MSPFRQLSSLVLLLCLFSCSSLASSASLKPDLRILIDVSGGMKTSDPRNRRASALVLLVNLLPDGAKAGIWVFGKEAELLVPHGLVDAAWRQQAQQAIATLKAAGQRTNIPAALEQATADLEQPTSGYRTSVLLLTAGKVDVAESPIINVNESRKLLNGRAVELGELGVPVHTIAFSAQADAMLLRSLARQTNGTSRQADSADELSVMFMRVLEMVAPVAQVPIIHREFTVDHRVQQLSVLTFFQRGKGKLRLIDPDGVILSSEDESGRVNWFRNQQFALATVNNPGEGTWRLKMPPKAFARALIVSDLELEVGPLPNYVPAGQQAELTLHLSDQGTVITDQEVLSGFNVSLRVKGPLGNNDIVVVDSPSTDGVYRVVTPVLAQPGRYQLLLRVDTQSLRRDLPIYLEVEVPAEQPTLVTRGQEMPEDDFKAPLMWLAGVCGLVLLGVWFILRRREQRKLALWQKRAREIGRNGSSRFSTSSASANEAGDQLD